MSSRLSSDLSRAHRTGTIVAELNDNASSIEVKKDSRLRERNYGEFEGKSVADYRAAAARAVSFLFPRILQNIFPGFGGAGLCAERG